MATPYGGSDPSQPNNATTIWRTICDCTNKRYYFEFCHMPNVVWVDLDDLDLSEGASEQMFNLDVDIEAGGDVAGKFKPTDPFVWQRAETAVTWTPDA